MIVIMLVNFFICFIVILTNGFPSIQGDYSKYMIFKQTYGILLGNFDDLQAGYGPDGFDEINSF